VKTPKDGKTSHCLWIGRITIAKMAIVLKAIYRFCAMPIKIPASFFTENPEFIWRYKRP
jgi:hypothetical protein